MATNVKSAKQPLLVTKKELKAKRTEVQKRLSALHAAKGLCYNTVNQLGWTRTALETISSRTPGASTATKLMFDGQDEVGRAIAHLVVAERYWVRRAALDGIRIIGKPFNHAYMVDLTVTDADVEKANRDEEERRRNVAYLMRIDRNGAYEDADQIADRGEPLTLHETRVLIARWEIEDPDMAPQINDPRERAIARLKFLDPAGCYDDMQRIWDDCDPLTLEEAETRLAKEEAEEGTPAQKELYRVMLVRQVKHMQTREGDPNAPCTDEERAAKGLAPMTIEEAEETLAAF